MITIKTHVCTCGHSIRYELDRINKNLECFDHIDMLKNCPKCKREMPLAQLLAIANVRRGD